MTSKIKIFALLLAVLLLAGCSGGSARAPIDSRSNRVDSDRLPAAASRPSADSRVISTSKPSVYAVKRGDTLSSIGRRYGMSYKEIANINGIPLPYNIRAGQFLRLKPDPAQTVVSAPVEEPSGAQARPLPVPAPKATPKAAPKPVTVPAPRPKVAVAPKPLPKPSPEPALIPEKETARSAPATNVVTVYDGKWQWPTRGRLLRGYRPKEPGKKGITIGGHNGQPVRAAANGKVVYVGSGLVGYGRLIIIRHGEDLLSTYGHNSELLVTEGEYVKAGQAIAKMGSSDNGRNELYFEIRKQGKPINPSSYLPKKP